MNIPPRPPARLTGWDALAALAVVLLGLANVPAPFHGDQALHCLGAGQVDRGAVLYRDFWDLRQPGLFGVYLAAGKLFGFTDAGVHLFELILLTGFAAALPGVVRPHLADGRLAALAPVLTVGFYYAVAGPWQLTQPEMFGSCLVLVAWRLASPGAGPARLLLAGVAGGTALGFKLLFAPLLMLAWAGVTAAAWRGRRPVRTAVPLAVGVGLVWLPLVMCFIRHDAGSVVWWTYFDLPPRLLRELPTNGFGVLADGLIWFTGHFSPHQAVALNGWSTGLYLPDMWADLAAQLRAARPAYVFVSNGNAELIRDRGPGVAAVVRDLYREHHRVGGGVWYRLAAGD